jgi:SnoaL-like protein
VSEEYVELYRAFAEELIACRSEADWQAWVDTTAQYFDPDIDWDASELDLPDAADGSYRGREAAKQFWREWLAAWETLDFEYELLDAGDCVVMLVLEQRMRGRTSGIEVDLASNAHLATFRDGLLVSWKPYMSQSEALKAAGLEG